MTVEKKAPAGKFRVVVIEWPNMDTLILGGDFNDLKDAKKKSDACNESHGMIARVFDDKGKTV